MAILLLGLVFCAVSVWLSSEKRRAIGRIGIAFVVFALVFVVLAGRGGSVLALFARPADAAPVVAGVAAAFLGGLRLWAAGLGFMGLVLTAASASLLERVPLQGWAGSVWTWGTGPQPYMRFRLARGILGIAVGGAVLIWPLLSLQAAGMAVGLVVMFVGLRETFVAALHLLPQIEFGGEGSAKHERASARSAAVLVATIAVVLVAIAAWVVLRTPPTPPGTEEITACNGSRSCATGGSTRSSSRCA